MAISKQQSERPAIVEIIDAVNALENASATQAGNITALTEGLADEIGDREAADEGLTNSLGATNAQVLGLTNDVNALEAAQPAVNSFMNRFKIGLTESVTVEMGNSVSDTFSFDEPFADDAEIGIFLICVDGSEILTNLSCKLISATYSGFSYAVFNDSESDVTIKVGYLAVRMG